MRENMTQLEILIDQNVDELDLSDAQSVTDFVNDGDPSPWQYLMGSEPEPTLSDVEAAIAVAVPVRLGRDWVAALSEPPSGPLCGANANHSVAWYKNAIANFETPE